ncbi:MAG: CCA tRNA nucleotidyltransferase [Anaerolineae bacterium]|nr:CCA tRNA nucleotidyltransferase [Anaerolineae bacterium]
MDRQAATTSPDLSPYLGRWVATVRGRVVGVGNSEQEATYLAKRNRPKEMPHTFLVTPDVQIARAIEHYPLIIRVFDMVKETPIYLVGGSVRDLLLGKKTHDLDFAVDGNGLTIARQIANQLGAAYVGIDRERRTGRVVLPTKNEATTYIDVASLRGQDLQADLHDRDLTINAIALERQTGGTWHIIDPLNGCQDLSAGILRATSSSSFTNDPIRTLRAVRMRSQFGCTIDPQTRDQLSAAASLLQQTSQERIRDEWFKILALPGAAQALEELYVVGLLHQIVPPFACPVERAGPLSTGLPDRLKDALAGVRAIEHLLASIQAPGALPIPRRLHNLAPQIQQRVDTSICDERTHLALLKCAVLMHNIGDASPLTRARAVPEDSAQIAAGLGKKWHCSNREIDLLRVSIASYPRLGALVTEPALTRRMIYRFFHDIGEAGIDALFIALAVHLARTDTSPDQAWQALIETATELLVAYHDRRTEIIDPPDLLSGHDLINYGLAAPGPRVGQLLDALHEAQAAGEVHTRDEALGYARTWLDASSSSKH